MSAPQSYPFASEACDCVWIGNGILAKACAAHLAWRNSETTACANVAASVHLYTDCDNRGIADPETGEVDCAIETRGGVCECALKLEAADVIAKYIRARLDTSI